MIDWNEDGLMDHVMLDHEDYLGIFERMKMEDGTLVLKPGKRVFYSVNGPEFDGIKEELEGGTGFIRNSRQNGGSERRKWCFVDWYLDGNLDVLVNNTNAAFYDNIGQKNGLYHFWNQGDETDQQLPGYTTSPTIMDWNKDGWPDLLLGAKDGFLYYLKNPDSP